MSSLAITSLSNATQIQQEFVSLSLATDTFQRDYIKQVFTTHTGNWAATARTLGVDPGNLHRLAKRLKLK